MSQQVCQVSVSGEESSYTLTSRSKRTHKGSLTLFLRIQADTDKQQEVCTFVTNYNCSLYALGTLSWALRIVSHARLFYSKRERESLHQATQKSYLVSTNSIVFSNSEFDGQQHSNQNCIYTHEAQLTTAVAIIYPRPRKTSLITFSSWFCQLVIKCRESLASYRTC